MIQELPISLKAIEGFEPSISPTELSSYQMASTVYTTGLSLINFMVCFELHSSMTTHIESFTTQIQASKFTKLSQNCSYIPTVQKQKQNCCYLEHVTPIKTQQELTKLVMRHIIRAIQEGIANNIYHLDIKLEHIGLKNNTGFLLDWDDAFFYTKSSNYNITHIPSNISSLLQNTTPKTLVNAIISQIGLLLNTTNIINSTDIYQNPQQYTLTQIKTVIL